MNIDWFDTLIASILASMQGAVARLPQFALALFVLAFVWAITKFAVPALARVFRAMRMRSSLVAVLTMLIKVAIWITGTLIALIIVFPSITPGGALATLGLGSVAIGFAFKDVFENFLAGILLLLREPFRTGDMIECDGFEGKVEVITIRDSHVRQTDGQLVVIPNAMLFKNPVVVRTDKALRRTTIICGVAYGEDVNVAKDTIETAVRAVDSVRDDVQDVQIFAKEFGASSIDFEVTWWTGSHPLDIRRSRDEVVRAIKVSLDTAGIEIPFPYRTMTWHNDAIDQMKSILSPVSSVSPENDAGDAGDPDENSSNGNAG